MDMEFRNKVIVVTGASRGVGALLTRMFVEAGASVLFSARTKEPLRALEKGLRDQGHDVHAWTADVGSHADCERLIAAAMERWGRIDVLVNNAGLSGAQKPIHELAYEEFDEVVRANQYSVYSCTHFAARHMVRQRSGVIVNVSSGITRRALPFRTAYVSSKRGLSGITATTALDLGPYGIRCNSVSPGAIAGPRLDEVVARTAESRGLPATTVANEFLERAALRAYVTDKDICETILFLCSRRARHITGQDIAVNAGSQTM